MHLLLAVCSSSSLGVGGTCCSASGASGARRACGYASSGLAKVSASAVANWHGMSATRGVNCQGG